MSNSIGLAEFIYQVKRELLQPQDGRADPAPILSVDEVELTIEVTVSKDAKAGINIHVLEVGGGAGRSDVHTVHVKLTPLLSREERIALLRRRPDWDRIQGAVLAATSKDIPEDEP